MLKECFKDGLKLMVISVIYRIISYFVLKKTMFVMFQRDLKLEVINMIMLIGFFLIWIIYCYRKRLGFKRGLLVGAISCIDGIIIILLGYALGGKIMGLRSTQVWIFWAMPLFSLITFLEKSKIPVQVTYSIPVFIAFISGISGVVGERVIKGKGSLKDGFMFTRMNRKYALDILTWKYPDKYEFYNMDFDPEDHEEFLKRIDDDSWEDYYAVLNYKKQLVGFFSYFTEDGSMSIGLGLKPQYTGYGIGEKFVRDGVSFGLSKCRAICFRVKLAVVDFNVRAIKVYERAGFDRTGEYIERIEGKDYNFIEMEWE